MEGDGKTILVAGSTGRQGGAVARALLAGGWRVRCLTRDPTGAAARALAGEGAEVVRGDLDDAMSLKNALSDVYGVFSIQNFYEHGYDKEVGQGRALADAAHATGVEHFVYSSVGGADRGTGIRHFESKWEIECHVRELRLPATILRPAFFMTNFSTPLYRPKILEGSLAMALQPDTLLQMIAVEDIGAFARLAFDQPDELLGEAIEIAGDELTLTRVAECFSTVLGRTVAFQPVPIERLRSVSAEIATMFQWFQDEGYRADIPTLRSRHTGLMTLETWLRRTWE